MLGSGNKAPSGVNHGQIPWSGNLGLKTFLLFSYPNKSHNVLRESVFLQIFRNLKD